MSEENLIENMKEKYVSMKEPEICCNPDCYTKLSEKIKTLQEDINKLKKKFPNEEKNLTEDEIVNKYLQYKDCCPENNSTDYSNCCTCPTLTNPWNGFHS
jgi:hypothetical protein